MINNPIPAILFGLTYIAGYFLRKPKKIEYIVKK
jgi:hypothetical protein